MQIHHLGRRAGTKKPPHPENSAKPVPKIPNNSAVLKPELTVWGIRKVRKPAQALDSYVSFEMELHESNFRCN